MDDDWDESAGRRSLKAVERFVRQVRGVRIHRVSKEFRLDFERIAKSALAGRLVRSLFQRDAARGRAVQPAEQADGQSMLAAQSRMRLPAAVLAHALRPLAEGGEAAETLNEIDDYWLPPARTDNQYPGVLTFAQQCFWDFSDPVPAWTLRFSVEPGDRRDGAAGGFDFAAAVDDEERRTVFLVQPRLGGGKDLIAKALKAAFFKAVLNSPERVRRGGEMPLVGYVADECHRFVTSDEVHGEQSFPDTCRSFGAKRAAAPGTCAMARRGCGGGRPLLRRKHNRRAAGKEVQLRKARQPAPASLPHRQHPRQELPDWVV